MKRWQVIALCVGVAAAGAWFYFNHGFRSGTSHGNSGSSGSETAGDTRAAQFRWQVVSRPEEGFRLDMPANPRELQVPAFNEVGSSEQVKMLFASPDGDTSFALTWEDNPPVARVNDRVPERTLDQAREGMLARTQTSLVSESRISANGYPGRDIVARNPEGGSLDARLIFINDRLYTLMALYPSTNARREQDVIRFYNSFTPMRVGTTLPAATPNGT